MARRILPSTSARIFTQRASWSSRILSGFLLGLSFCVTVAGIATAVYLERPHDPPLRPPPLVAASQDMVGTTLPATPTQTAAMGADAALRSAQPDAPGNAAWAEPQPRDEPGIGTTAPDATGAPASPQTALLEPLPAEAQAPQPTGPAAAPVASDHHYWVEYGVFVGARYAKRLQEALAAHGLDAVVVPTHGSGHRPLLRVRSAPLADYARARDAAENAGRMLRLTALIHRSSIGSGQLAAAKPAMAARKHEFWVQFGAFPHHWQAARLRNALAQGGIDTVVTGLRAPSGRPVFAVRSPPLPDRPSAAAIAMRGQQAGNVDFLIGQRGEAAPDRPRKARSPAVPQAG
jgi:cell division protein FtsN